jgi:hypothetical protein
MIQDFLYIIHAKLPCTYLPIRGRCRYIIYLPIYTFYRVHGVSYRLTGLRVMLFSSSKLGRGSLHGFEDEMSSADKFDQISSLPQRHFVTSVVVRSIHLPIRLRSGHSHTFLIRSISVLTRLFH